MTDDTQTNVLDKNQPKKKFTAGGIKATVWENQVKDTTEVYHTVSVQRCYKDKAGNWKHTDNLRQTDVPKAILVLQKAYEFMVLKKDE